MEPSRPATGVLLDRCLIDDVVVDAGQRRLWRDEHELPVTRLTFDLLLALMERSPSLVTHDEIIARVWGPRRIVSTETVAQCVTRLRHALGDDAAAPRYIESIRGNGYRLIPPVRPFTGVEELTHSDQMAAQNASFWSSFRPVSGVAALFLVAVLVAMGLGRLTGDDDVAASGLAARPEALAVLPRSVAVLPIDGADMGAADALIADGLHADILSELARIGELSVIARATMRRYSGTDLSLPAIAAELGVEAIMQLDLRRADGRLNLTAELVDGQTGTQTWFARYDEHLDNVYGLQRELAADAAAALGVRLSDAETARLQARPTTSAEAYELFLAAVEAFEIDFADRAMIARALLDKAVSIDANFARAYGLKGLIYAYGIDDFTDSDEDMRAVQAERARLAEMYADQALAIDPGTVVAYRARAIAAMHSWRWAQAEQAFESALEHGPNDIAALSDFAYFEVCALGNPAGLRHAERAIELDPGNPRAHEMSGRSLNCAGEFEPALAALRRSVALDVTSLRRRAQSAYIAARIRPAEQAVLELRDLEPLLRDVQLQSVPPIALTYKQLGYPEDARRLIARFEELEGHANTNLGNSVFAYLAVDDEDAAYRTLARAVDNLGPGSGFLTLLALRHNVRGLPTLDEPRFVRLRERIGSID